MIQTRHCDLSKHVKKSLKKGFTCGLTNEKTPFKRTCPNIKINNSSKENITELLSEIEITKSNKKSIYFNFIIGIGFFILFKLTLIIYGLGSLILSITYRNLNSYRKKIEKLEYQKSKIKKVIDKYEIDFNTIIKPNRI